MPKAQPAIGVKGLLAKMRRISVGPEELSGSSEFNGVSGRTSPIRTVEVIEENRGLANRRKRKNENPAAAATANGAIRQKTAPTVSEYLNPTARAISALLTAAEDGDADACKMAIRALRQLPGIQVATIAAVSLMSLDAEDVEDVAFAAVRHIGSPLPTFLSPMDEARFWAECASRAERKSYALASFEAMHPEDQTAFLRHVSSQGVAA